MHKKRRSEGKGRGGRGGVLGSVNRLLLPVEPNVTFDSRTRAVAISVNESNDDASEPMTGDNRGTCWRTGKGAHDRETAEACMTFYQDLPGMCYLCSQVSGGVSRCPPPPPSLNAYNAPSTSLPPPFENKNGLFVLNLKTLSSEQAT